VVQTDETQFLEPLFTPGSKQKVVPPVFFTRKSRITALEAELLYWSVKPIEETENFGVYQLIAK
ncbi:MAG TPA: hypothetical protein VK171_15590, partial [Fimbriimonas sp.]|nr:hypothetical protein [Fimbriimonas sp.]